MEENNLERLMCDVCNSEIYLGQRFVETYRYEGVRKKEKQGYVKGSSDYYLSRSLGYVHLSHLQNL